MPVFSCYLNRLGIVCALGVGRDAVRDALWNPETVGVAVTDRYSFMPLALGRLPIDDVDLPDLDEAPIDLKSRNNRVSQAALAQIRDDVDAAILRYGRDRVGVVIGTSTSGIAEGEAAIADHSRTGAFPPWFHYRQQTLASPALYLSRLLGVSGPVHVHSSACTSSAKAMAAAARLIRAGLCDAVVTGGVDTLCRFTVAGFSALESVSETRCNPMSVNRSGINIGEGAALFLMTREPAPVALTGWGESSDAHHLSAPDPLGIGAEIAVRKALRMAQLTASDIDYVNLHGTATRQNDAMEAHLIARLFPDGPKVSSTKPLTGHALGAAGAIEAGLCWLTLQDDNRIGRLPRHLWDGHSDPELPRLNLVGVDDELGQPPRHVLSQSFAFGGANAALILSRTIS